MLSTRKLVVPSLVICMLKGYTFYSIAQIASEYNMGELTA